MRAVLTRGAHLSTEPPVGLDLELPKRALKEPRKVILDYLVSERVGLFSR